MERLSYLATFISLMYGLGVANVLAHLASLIKRDRKADWYWVHTLWSVYLLLLMASMWWTLQNWEAVPHIGYLDYLSLLLTPSILFIASDVLFPERHAAAAVDLKAHFFAVKNTLFWLQLALLAADVFDTLLKGWQHLLALGPVYWVTQVFWIGACITGLRARSGKLLGLLACMAIVVLIASMANLLVSA